jgi:hypothetical protein
MKNQRSQYATRLSTLTVLLALASSVGCRPGYLRASDLESSGQGPAACAKSCEDLGMRMGALVLVSNSLPGCVCQPVVAASASASAVAPAVPAVAPPAVAPVAPPPASPPVAPGTTPAPAPAPSTTPTSALPADSAGAQAAAVTTGFVVLAAAAAVQQGEQEHQRRAQAIVY